MSLAMNHNEPSCINATTCGYLINTFREQLTENSKKPDPLQSNFESKLFLTGSMIGLGLLSGAETIKNLLSTAFWSLIYACSPSRGRSYLLESFKATLISARIFSVTTNPFTLIPLIGLSSLKRAYEHESNGNSNFENVGHGLQMGPFAKLQGHYSIFQETYAGTGINRIREILTRLENLDDNSSMNLILARCSACAGYLVLGAASGIEAVGYLMSAISFGIYLMTIKTAGVKKLFSITDEAISKKQDQFETLLRKFFVAFLITGQMVNPLTASIDLMTHFHSDAYKIPKDTAQVIGHQTNH